MDEASSGLREPEGVSMGLGWFSGALRETAWTGASFIPFLPRVCDREAQVVRSAQREKEEKWVELLCSDLIWARGFLRFDSSGCEEEEEGGMKLIGPRTRNPRGRGARRRIRFPLVLSLSDDLLRVVRDSGSTGPTESFCHAVLTALGLGVWALVDGRSPVWRSFMKRRETSGGRLAGHE